MTQDNIIPDLLFSVLCDDVRREANGKLIFIGVFETISSHEFPATHPVLYVVNAWIGGVGTFQQRTRLLNLEGELLAQDQETAFTLHSLKARHCVIARFDRLLFPVPGEYSVEILLGDELKLRYPLLVHEAKSA